MTIRTCLAAISLTGCMVAGTTPVSGPTPASGPMPASGPIEAGCSFTGLDLKGEIGAMFEVACPDNCATPGGVWGTDVYTRDSVVCRAGIHAGAIPSTGGVVTVRLEPGRPAYRGTAQHAMQSGDYGSYPSSFAVLGVAQ